jgi:hypothetical protein
MIHRSREAQSVQRQAAGWTAGFRFPAEAKVFSSPDLLSGPTCLLYNEYRGRFLWGKEAGA